MGGVLSYSGLSTKIRAMQSRLTTMDQFEEILQLSDVTQVAAYLKRMPEYSSRWDALDENTLHRGQIEKLLKKSIFQNFSRIYHFANPEQRKFLDLYSKRYEIRVLKEVMTNIFDHRDTDPVDVSPYREFFRLHSNIDVDRITTCSTMEELISCLKGNEFYIPLSKIQEHETALLFDYGMALDLYYFTQIWNIRKKLFKGKDLEEITCTYGEKFDMLNLQFIQRSKRYYNMDPASIYALLIPVNYKLKKEEITALVEAPSYEEGRRIFQKTWYGNKYEQLTAANLEEFYNHIHRSILEKESHRNPYSVAVIYSYLYNKEHEVNRLTIAIECVRYGDDAALHIGRVIGLPGETVQISNGAVLINGEVYNENKNFPEISNAGLASDGVSLESGEYFVLGDNRNNSEDSRYGDIGNINKKYIVGKVWFVISPKDKFGFLKG